MKRLFLLLFLAFAVWAALPASAFDEDHHETINGATLHFRVRGANKANPYLLILHGGPGFSAHMFYPWGPRLEKTLNVVYLDQRGSGESARLTVANLMNPKPEEVKGYTVAALVEDIEGVRRSLKVDKWYVLGHSWGGMLGLEYETAHPTHVRGYIHMDGLVSVPQVENAILDSAQAKLAAATPKDDVALAQVAQMRALPPDNPLRLLGAFGQAMGPAGLYFAGSQPAGFAASREQIRQAVQPYHVAPSALVPASEPSVALMVNDHYLTRDDTPLLAKVTVPTLIINGKQDGIVTPALAEAAHAALKGSQLVELDNCGHFPFFEQPEKTAAAVLAFISTGRVFVQDGHIIQPPMISHGIDDIKLPKKIDMSKINAKVISVSWGLDDQGNATNITFPPTGSSDVDKAIIRSIRSFHIRPGKKDGQTMVTTLKHTFTIAD